MRLIDYIALMLTTYAQVLQASAEFLGEPALLSALSNSEVRLPEEKLPLYHFLQSRAESEDISDQAEALSSLAETVSSLGFSSDLEDQLWSLAHYRCYIESHFSLNQLLPPSSRAQEDSLGIVEMQFALNEWLRQLSIPAGQRPKLERVVNEAWLRFRAKFLEKNGKNRLRAV